MIAERLREDLHTARLERDAAQREVAELRESIARDIEAFCIPNARNIGLDAEYLNDGLNTAAAIARGLA